MLYDIAVVYGYMLAYRSEIIISRHVMVLVYVWLLTECCYIIIG